MGLYQNLLGVAIFNNYLPIFLTSTVEFLLVFYIFIVMQLSLCRLISWFINTVLFDPCIKLVPLYNFCYFMSFAEMNYLLLQEDLVHLPSVSAHPSRPVSRNSCGTSNDLSGHSDVQFAQIHYGMDLSLIHI